MEPASEYSPVPWDIVSARVRKRLSACMDELCGTTLTMEKTQLKRGEIRTLKWILEMPREIELDKRKLGVAG